jgi:hypothetical protein
MAAFKDDQGEPMSIGATGLIALVPVAMYWTAVNATAGPGSAGGALTAGSGAQSNAITNQAVVNGPNLEVIAVPWLTTATTWYLFKADGHIRPFVMQEREPIQFDAIDKPTDDSVFATDKYLYGVRGRYVLAYGEWRYGVSVTFTT